MSKQEHTTKSTEAQACDFPTREALVRFITDILFTILLFFLVFCVSLGLNIIGKSWDSALVILLQLFVLFLISSATICSLIFILQRAFDFFKSLRISRDKNLRR